LYSISPNVDIVFSRNSVLLNSHEKSSFKRYQDAPFPARSDPNVRIHPTPIFSATSGSGTCASPTSGQATYTYDYDRYGNRWHQNGPWSTQLSFSGNNNRMDSHSYDAAGNLVNDGTHNYTYDAENRLTQVDAGATASYIYDADGRRVRKTTASTSVDYLYDLAGQEITELSSAGAWNRGEVFAGDRHLATYANSTTYFIHSDGLGTERVRSNVSGAACESIQSLPFGDGMTTSGSCSDVNPFHFTGKERDSESGLDNFGARYDSSSLGRFMSPDPIYIEAGKLADPQQLNLYSYVRNNPLNLTDPTGMLVDVNCQQVSAAQCSQTVTDFNNRDGAQFQVTRDDKTGQLNVSGDVDVSKLSDSEHALYNAVTDTSATGTINVVGNDSSFDFEKYSGPGQNTVDRSDLNALNGADKRLSGEILAHAAIESFQSASLAATEPGLSSAKIGQIAHDRARKAFGFALDTAGYQPNTAGTLVTALSLNFRATRLNVDFRVTVKLVTPIPLASFNSQRIPGPRDVTNVSILPPEK